MYRNDKYQVFARSTGVEIEDAVVIRMGDVFAASAFYSYANQVMTAIEVIELSGLDVPPQLREIADYFNTVAALADLRKDKKVPD